MSLLSHYVASLSTYIYMESNATFLSLSRPVEMLQVHLTPSDFFTQNPAIDVPGEEKNGSILIPTCCKTQN